MNDAPSTRHGDVFIAVWIIVGTTALATLTISASLRLPSVALAIIGAAAAGYGEALARGLRPHMRFTETAVAVVIAFLLVPHVAGFGGPIFDRAAIITIVVGTPLGLGAAYHVRRANLRGGLHPEIFAGIAMIAAAMALAVIILGSIYSYLPGRHAIEVAFVITGLAAGVTFGALVPTARAGHLILGALVVVFVPRLVGIGVLRYIPLFDVVVWVGVLGISGAAGCLVGKVVRTRAVARSPVTSPLPEARIHDDPG